MSNEHCILRFRIDLIIPHSNKGSIKEPIKEPVNMMVLIASVAGAFFIIIIAIVVVCILMRNIQRSSAKKAGESAERSAKNANDDTVSMPTQLYVIPVIIQYAGAIERMPDTATLSIG